MYTARKIHFPGHTHTTDPHICSASSFLNFLGIVLNVALVFAERRNARAVVALWMVFYAGLAVSVMVTVVTGFGDSFAAFAR